MIMLGSMPANALTAVDSCMAPYPRPPATAAVNAKADQASNALAHLLWITSFPKIGISMVLVRNGARLFRIK